MSAPAPRSSPRARPRWSGRTPDHIAGRRHWGHWGWCVCCSKWSNRIVVDALPGSRKPRHAFAIRYS
jgi:hypothetical protein